SFQAAFDGLRKKAWPGPLQRPPPRPRVISILSAAFCWMTLLAELIVPPFLLWRRTRVPAAIVLAIFFLGVELVAWELMFGGLMAILLGAALFEAPEPFELRLPERLGLALTAGL